MKRFDWILYCLISGTLLSLTHGFVPALGVVAVVPLFLALRNATGREAFYGGLSCGMLESAILLGVLNYHWSLFVGLCLLYGLQRALFAMVYRWLGQNTGPGLRSALAPALWVLLEYGHVLLPGTLPNLLGDTQHEGIFLPLARVGGTYLVAFVLIGVNACVAEGILHWRERGALRPLYPVWIGFGLVLGGLYFLAWESAPESGGESHRVNVVQGGFPRWVNRVARSNEAWGPVPFNIYQRLSIEANDAELTVWPEAAVWNYWGKDKAYEEDLRALSAKRGALMVGVLRRDEGGTPFNSGLFLESGKVQLADKQRLVFQEELMFGQGEKPALFESSMGILGAVFCLESVVPSYTRRLAREGAKAVVVFASGSDLGHTPVARIHAQRSVLRAVEIGRTVIHAGNHGFSMVIDPWGGVRDIAPVFEATVMEGDFDLRQQSTYFTRFGFLPLLVLSSLLVGAGLFTRIRKAG